MENKPQRMHIKKNTVASFRYVMKNDKQDVLENTMDASPVSYLHGSLGVLPALQSQLEGLKAGDRKVLRLHPEEGKAVEDFIFEIVIDDVRAASEEELLLGRPVSQDTADCGPGCNC